MSEKLPDTLPERITYLREEAGLSKARLAKMVGVSDVTIGYWERGQITAINHHNLLALGNALEITVSELLDDPWLPDLKARWLAGETL